MCHTVFSRCSVHERPAKKRRDSPVSVRDTASANPLLLIVSHYNRDVNISNIRLSD